jgi:glycosyltransferase involved in cell wall biosynthesis
MIDKTKRLQVTLYTGELPTTTFIERLAVTLAMEGVQVTLVGKIKKRYRSPHKGVKIIGFNQGLYGALQMCWRYLRLRLFFSSRYRQVRLKLSGSPFAGGGQFQQWQRALPMLLNLPQIFHVQWTRHVDEWVWLKPFGVKLMVSLRGSHVNYSPLADKALAHMYKAVLPQYDGFHAVSKAIAREGEQWGVVPAKTKVIYSGLPAGKFPEGGMSGRNKGFRILVVGRMHWVKGYHYLFDTITILKGRKFPVTVTLLASGEMPEELLYQVHSLDLKDGLHWIKGLPHEKVLEQMREHDVLVLPSVEEGIANVVLEAMSVGLPVISTDCGGMREVIESGSNGLLVPVRNPKALADAIEFFSTVGPARVEVIRQNAYTTMVDKFNQANTRRQFVEFYNRVLECT